MESLRRGLKRFVRKAIGDGRRRGKAGAVNVNLAGRPNVVVAGNVGQSGATHRVSATQTTGSIHQTPDKTDR